MAAKEKGPGPGNQGGGECESKTDSVELPDASAPTLQPSYGIYRRGDWHRWWFNGVFLPADSPGDSLDRLLQAQNVGTVNYYLIKQFPPTYTFRIHPPYTVVDFHGGSAAGGWKVGSKINSRIDEDMPNSEHPTLGTTTMSYNWLDDTGLTQLYKGDFGTQEELWTFVKQDGENVECDMNQLRREITWTSKDQKHVVKCTRYYKRDVHQQKGYLSARNLYCENKKDTGRLYRVLSDLAIREIYAKSGAELTGWDGKDGAPDGIPEGTLLRVSATFDELEDSCKWTDTTYRRAFVTEVITDRDEYGEQKEACDIQRCNVHGWVSLWGKDDRTQYVKDVTASRNASRVARTRWKKLGGALSAMRTLKIKLKPDPVSQVGEAAMKSEENYPDIVQEEPSPVPPPFNHGPKDTPPKDKPPRPKGPPVFRLPPDYVPPELKRFVTMMKVGVPKTSVFPKMYQSLYNIYKTSCQQELTPIGEALTAFVKAAGKKPPILPFPELPGPNGKVACHFVDGVCSTHQSWKRSRTEPSRKPIPKPIVRKVIVCEQCGQEGHLRAKCTRDTETAIKDVTALEDSQTWKTWKFAGEPGSIVSDSSSDTKFGFMSSQSKEKKPISEKDLEDGKVMILETGTEKLQRNRKQMESDSEPDEDWDDQS